MLPELPTLYWYLALARIILVLIPQLGYIHPDEFFQSIEVEAGNNKINYNVTLTVKL
jgi:phosphatidylinositol glycan class Z